MPEVRARAKELLERASRFPILTPGILPELRAIQVLERIGGMEAQSLLRELAEKRAAEPAGVAARAALERVECRGKLKERFEAEGKLLESNQAPVGKEPDF